MRYPFKGTDVAPSERSRKWLFCVQCRLLMTKQCTNVVVAIEKSDALTDKPARELSAVSQEQGKRGDVELRPCLMVALEIEADLMGVVVVKDGQSRGYHPLGLSYGKC